MGGSSATSTMRRALRASRRLDRESTSAMKSCTGWSRRRAEIRDSWAMKKVSRDVSNGGMGPSPSDAAARYGANAVRNTPLRRALEVRGPKGRTPRFRNRGYRRILRRRRGDAEALCQFAIHHSRRDLYRAPRWASSQPIPRFVERLLGLARAPRQIWRVHPRQQYLRRAARSSSFGTQRPRGALARSARELGPAGHRSPVSQRGKELRSGSGGHRADRAAQ